MINNGELYAVPLIGGGFVTAHVVMSVAQVKSLGRVPAGSQLLHFGDLLVDLYGPLTDKPSATLGERLIHGIWILDRAITGRDKPRWEKIGTREIDPATVEFPELVLNANEKGEFVKGEIKKTLPLDSDDVERIGARTPFCAPGKVAKICANLVGRGELLGEMKILFELEGNFDLRYNANREEVYRAMGVPPTRSYFEWATAEGLDPGRLWR
jgi:hypothetical protein